MKQHITHKKKKKQSAQTQKCLRYDFGVQDEHFYELGNKL